MEIHPDFKELLRLLNARHVEYMIVGGYALAYFGAPRFTGDLDLWVKPEMENARRILRVLDDLGFTSLNLTIEDFVTPEKVIQLGIPPIRVDFITSLT